MIILGVDFGSTRTGLAVCDRDELLASPYTVLVVRDFESCVQKTADLAQQLSVGQIVVGHPINMNGSCGERAKLCEEFAEKVQDMSGIPTVLWDERRTTVSAHQILNTTNTRGKKRKNTVDAVAATLILESYLAYRKNVMNQKKEDSIC